MKILCAPRDGRGASASAYALLEYAYRGEYGAVLPEIKKTPNGKPYFPSRPEVYFSLSHTGTHVLCALSDSPIGVDIESPRDISPRALKFFCLPGELDHFDPLDLWVLKESYIKLVGGTLALMRTICFSRRDGNDRLSGFLREPGDIITPDENVISRLYRVTNCRAAVSSLGTQPSNSVELIDGSDDSVISSHYRL